MGKHGIEEEMRQRQQQQVEEENQAAEQQDELEAETEQQVLHSEKLSWERNQIKPLDEEDLDEDGRSPVEPAKPAKAIECDRDCKVRKQLEKEQAEAAVVPSKDYDLHNEENIHNAVTDSEASDLNQQRGDE